MPDHAYEAARRALMSVRDVPTDMPKKIAQYATKALQATSKSGQWNARVEEFIKKFCETTSGAIGDKAWFLNAIETIDFEPVIFAVVWEQLPPPAQRNARRGGRDEEQIVADAFSSAWNSELDNNRVRDFCWEVTGRYFRDNDDFRKKAYQYMWKAWGSTKSSVMGDWHRSRGRGDPTDYANDFAKKWVGDALQRMCQAIVEIRATLPVEDAKQLFQEAFQRGCLPTDLERAVGPPPRGWWDVNVAVRDAYAEHAQDSDGTGAPPPQWSSKKRKRKAREESEEEEQEEEEESMSLRELSTKRTRNRPAPPSAPPPRPRYRGQAKLEGELNKPPFFSSSTKKEKYEEPEDEDGDDEDDHQRCTECTSAEECIGSPTDDLYKHIDDGKEGDIYCASCWESFQSQHPNLESEHIPRAWLDDQESAS